MPVYRPKISAKRNEIGTGNMLPQVVGCRSPRRTGANELIWEIYCQGIVSSGRKWWPGGGRRSKINAAIRSIVSRHCRGDSVQWLEISINKHSWPRSRTELVSYLPKWSSWWSWLVPEDRCSRLVDRCRKCPWYGPTSKAEHRLDIVSAAASTRVF